MTQAIRFRLLTAATSLAANSYLWQGLLNGTEKLPVSEKLFQNVSDQLRRESGLPEWDAADLLAVLAVTRRAAACN